jgi:cytochrome c oxidase subunit 2
MYYKNLPARVCFAIVLTQMLAACNENRDSAPMNGAQLAEAKGCTACHAFTAESGIGPGWGSLTWGQPRTFADGSSLTVNEAYLRLSMQDPALKVVEGYSNLMVQPDLTDAEREILVAFIRELAMAGSEADLP